MNWTKTEDYILTKMNWTETQNYILKTPSK